MKKIKESTRISDILNEHPELTDYLMETGLCGCDYGPDNILNRDIAQAAREKGLDQRTLLDELNRRIG